VDHIIRRAIERKLIVPKRAAQWLSNHGYDVADIIVEVITGIPDYGEYWSTCHLKSGDWGDEYYVRLDDDWYLKFTIGNDTIFVTVLSCCWDGSVH
jgi:hypothetical protein